VRARGLAQALLPALAGMGIGELAWGMAQQHPNFLWPELSRAGFWGLGALLGLGQAALQSGFWRLAFDFSLEAGWRLGSASSLPLMAGWLWPFMQRLKLPAPHDFPLRSLQVGAGSILVACLGLSLAAGLAGIYSSRHASQLPTKSLALRLFGLAWLAYLISGLWSFQWLMTGDAPHFVLIADSLARRGSAELSQAYAGKDYLLYYDQASLEPQLPPVLGALHSQHRPGYPLLLLPAQALLGPQGARWTNGALAALGGALFFLLLSHLGFGRPRALLGWGLFSFSAGWWIHSQVCLAEASAGVMALALFCSWESVIPALWGWLALGSLFWINARFYPMAGLAWFASLWIMPQSKAGKGLGAMLSLGLLAGILMVNVHDFGSWNPAAPYRLASVGQEELYAFRLAPAFSVLGALFLDQEYGWFWFCPVLILCLRGSALVWREQRMRAWRAALLIAPCLGPLLLIRFWHGDMAPARYLVPLVPLLFWLALESYFRLAWTWRLGLGLWSFAMGLAVTALPWLAFSKKQGQQVLLQLLGRMGGINLTRLFPSFIIGNVSSEVATAVFAVALFFAWYRASSGPRPFGAGAGPCSTDSAVNPARPGREQR
jgi:hypothetical protein